MYRSYLYMFSDGARGQTQAKQINNLAALENLLGVPGQYLKIQNGFARELGLSCRGTFDPHTCTHTSIHPCTHASIQHPYTHPYTHTPIHHTSIHPHLYTLTHTYTPIHPYTLCSRYRYIFSTKPQLKALNQELVKWPRRTLLDAIKVSCRDRCV